MHLNVSETVPPDGRIDVPLDVLLLDRGLVRCHEDGVSHEDRRGEAELQGQQGSANQDRLPQRRRTGVAYLRLGVGTTRNPAVNPVGSVEEPAGRARQSSLDEDCEIDHVEGGEQSHQIQVLGAHTNAGRLVVREQEVVPTEIGLAHHHGAKAVDEDL